MKKISGYLMAAAAGLMLPGLAEAAHPYKGFHFGLAYGVGYSIVHEDVYLAARLNFRIMEQFTVFAVMGSLGQETIEEQSSYTYYDWEGNPQTSHWTQKNDESVPELAAGLRFSLIQFEDPIKRTFFMFNADKMKFVHLRFVKLLKPYAEVIAGTSVGLGAGLEIQPVTNFSVDVGVNAGYSFLAEDQTIYVAPRVLLGFYLF